MGHKLCALRIISVFLGMEMEASLSFSEMYINVSQFEGSDIISVDANDLSALSDDSVTGNLHGNQELFFFFLTASLHDLAFDPQLKGCPEENFSADGSGTWDTGPLS